MLFYKISGIIPATIFEELTIIDIVPYIMYIFLVLQM
uniref:Uncharacterized protein n=1 Tax=Moniliophthora roreri TaxID=221103 RepID=A0A0W0G147_MONRR